MSRGTTLILIVAIWTAIYLPWLGTPELRSEEGHRVLPAVEMMDTGNYLVPHVGGQPYLRKPPLVNWLVIAAFRIAGVRNEWAARLPSALTVLLAALTFVILGHKALGDRGSFVAAAAWLTNLGLIEKGRMIEIDAIYVSLFAIALICWISAWSARRPSWITWIVPWVFLGLATLAKGPAHLFFFYAVVAAVLWRTRRMRDLVQPAHFVGILLMICIFGAWAVPCWRDVHQQQISDTWAHELAMRITGGENDATDWPMNFPRAFGYFMPWLFVLPFVRPRLMRDDSQRAIASGLAWAAAIPCVVILLLPGTIPRYILPTLVPVCWLIGMATRDAAFNWRLNAGAASINIQPRWLWGFVVVFATAAAVVFAGRSATFLKNRPKVKPIAALVNAAVPVAETLYAVNPLFQPYLFYVQPRVKYVGTAKELPPDAHYLVAGPTEVENVTATGAWRSVLTTPSYRGHSTVLFRRDR